jgi:hypothetical protein
MKIVVLSLLLVVGAQAQTAKVVALSGEDAQRAASLHRLLIDTQSSIKQFDADIRAKYLRNPDNKTNHTPRGPIESPGWNYQQYGFKEGWGTGDFEYSDDYKYIVPAPKLEFNINQGSTIPAPYRPSSPGDYIYSGPLSGIQLNPDGTTIQSVPTH